MSTDPVLVTARQEAEEALSALYGSLRTRGFGAPSSAGGHLIRPLLSLAGAAALERPRDPAFWAAAGAVQLAHEASLLHDDVIDEAAVRRSAPTVSASRGVAAALVEGDHLLTTSYRLAAAAESPAYFAMFARAVERTVAGEKLQGRSAGMMLDESAWRRIVSGKSGELLGCALAAAAAVADAPGASSLYVLGRRVGELYQMLDDLLDYCPDADTGKPPLADYRQRRWTWPLLELRIDGFDEPAEVVAERFAGVDETGTSALRRCLSRFEHEVVAVRTAIAVHMPHDRIVTALVTGWRDHARAAVARVEAAAMRRRARADIERLMPARTDVLAYFAENSRTFSFAARAFPAAFRERVARIYVFCRVTDDIVDAPRTDADCTPAQLLELWRELAFAAWSGTPSGITLLDDVMRDAAGAGVPFAYVDELIEGMRMDLRARRYASLAELRVYCYRVAGVIGQWLTRVAGVHDAHVLDRAAELGHALQLTNIVRDVGEDLRAGRVYLPADMMADAGIDENSLRTFPADERAAAAYRELIERLMAEADRAYARALAATPALPAFFRRAVVVAAHVYRGIHDEIRAAEYDNLRRRAHTSLRTKLRLAFGALHDNGRQLASVAHTAGGRGATVARPRRSSPVTQPASVRRVLMVLLTLLVGAAVLALDAVPQQSHAQHEPLESRNAHAALDSVRTLFAGAIDNGGLVERGHALIAGIRGTLPQATAERDPLLLAYEGAFTALEAKHGSWPHARLISALRGLQLLDRAVETAPHDLEIRYLRMINGYHLPGLFGRGRVTAEDMALLTWALPLDADRYPPSVRSAIVSFIIEHGALDAALAERLQAVADPRAAETRDRRP